MKEKCLLHSNTIITIRSCQDQEFWVDWRCNINKFINQWNGFNIGNFLPTTYMYGCQVGPHQKKTLKSDTDVTVYVSNFYKLVISMDECWITWKHLGWMKDNLTKIITEKQTELVGQTTHLIELDNKAAL